MAKTRRPLPPAIANQNKSIGVSPTQSQKLLYIAGKLGLYLSKMQGSTVNIFDTVLLNTSATARQTLSFFTQTQNKSRNFSNFQTGNLNAGEAMVIENIAFFFVSLTGSSLQSDATAMTDIFPISQVAAGVTIPKALQLGLVNITIANSKVVKDYNTFEMNPNFNPKTTGISMGGYDSGGTPTIRSEVIGQNTITLESPPVLPPNQKLEISLEIPPCGTVSAGVAIMCVAGRFGSIFSAKTPL